MNDRRCEINRYQGLKTLGKCGVLAVSIWKTKGGDLAVCEQCEAAVVDIAKSGVVSAIFEAIED